MSEFFVYLAVLAGTYAATGSEVAQWLALFALIFLVSPAVTRRFGVPAPEWKEAATDRYFPLGPIAWMLAFACGWGAVVVLFAPDLDVGGWLWWWVVIWPSAELLGVLLTRRVKRDGGTAEWKPTRPVRDSALAGVATMPLVVVPMLVDGSSVSAALATGVGCGIAIVAFISVLTWWPGGSARSKPPTSR